jgi:translation initiation factor 2 subunit 1
MTNELEEGQIVLCTVDKILGTTVFVKIEGGGEGTLTTSEISPGRIRNLRDYVVPGKKIVCKILKIEGDKIQLSLRRVKQQEKRELLDKIAKEKSYRAILKTVLGKEEAEKIAEEITQDYTLLEFFAKAKQDTKILSKYLSKENTEKIKQIIESKKEKEKEIKQVFRLSNKSSQGMPIIKKIILDACQGTDCNVSYLAAGKYSATLKGENFKELKTKMNKILSEIEKQAKKKGSDFSSEKA